MLTLELNSITFTNILEGRKSYIIEHDGKFNIDDTLILVETHLIEDRTTCRELTVNITFKEEIFINYFIYSIEIIGSKNI
jgi:hypothetical protein